ncbi:MAG: zinc-binding dehydrogenase [Gemmatimonadetes bacterium]|nr:zinc-binding dehydrogenase [Gemmatimonadota bacterium]
MKAAVFYGPNRPLEIADVPTPRPGAGEVLVRIAGCGLCHTDLHYLDHGVKTFKAPPLILGHEAAGIVAELGPGVTGRVVGDRVLIPSVLGCGYCEYCRQGRENLCSQMVMLGNNIDGGYAEMITVPGKDLLPVPPELPLERACVIADALSTPFHAVRRRARVRLGESVVVVGCGGVGLNVVQCAAAAGGRVIALDLNDARLDLAKRLGAAVVINTTGIRRIDKKIRQLTDGGADVAIEAIGSPATIELAFGLLRRGGRLCVIGYSPEPVSISAARLMYYELEVVGSLGCGAGEYREILALVAAGTLQLEPIVSGTLPLAEINTGFDRLRRGEGVRWVVAP